jgi:hypothetical protein
MAVDTMVTRNGLLSTRVKDLAVPVENGEKTVWDSGAGSRGCV